MSDFAYAYFNSELDKLDIPSLEEIYEKVQVLLAKKRPLKTIPILTKQKSSA